MTLEPLGSLDRARAAWHGLAEANGNLFATFEWAEAWCRHFLGDRELHLLAVRREDGTASALLPLVASRRRPLRVLRWVGDGPADRLGPLCAPEDRPEAAAAVRTALRDLRADLLVGDAMPLDEGWEPLLGGTALRREASPVLATEGRSWDEFLASRSRNFREQVRRRERKLGKEHDLRFRLSDDPDRLDDDMRTLFALHDARWGGGVETFAGPRAAFHLDFARAALEQGWLRLWLLELDGAPVAAWHGFRYAGCEWYYQMGRDPRFDRQSVGFVLLCHTMREAFDGGVREYRLLRGNEEYKDRFATHDPGLATVAVARTVRGRAAIAAGEAVRRLPDAPRRRLVRLTG